MLTHFQIFGERNSGTNYLKDVIEDNFNLKHTTDYGYKHWFIKNHYPRGEPNQTTDRECLKSLRDPDADKVLFIFIVREPLEWLSSMNKNPWNAPNHYKLSFSEFIRKPWISFEKMCPSNHTRHWLMTNGIYFIEEAPNICILRNLKNAHFTALRDKVKHFWIVRQDRLEHDLIDMCTSFDITPKWDKLRFKHYRRPKPALNISDNDLEFIKTQLNLDLEQELGFGL